MKLLLFAASLIFFHFSAAALVSIDETLQRIHQEMEQLKEKNDKKIASLEQQLKLNGNLVPPSVRDPAAFSTRLDENTNLNDSPVIFETVDLNIGDGYDEFTGVFRRPVHGVYLLTFYGLVTGGNGGNVYIKRNDDFLCAGWLQADQHHSTAICTAVAELTTDDFVRVTGNNGDPSALRGNSYSGFTGVLIHKN